MASSGLVTQITNALGQYFLMPLATAITTLVLMLTRSSRLIPGLRGTPAIVLEDGTLFSGYLAPKQLIEAIASTIGTD